MALTDARIIALFRDAEILKAEAARISSEAKAKTDKIVKEMLSRGTKVIENNGQRVTLVQAETVEYDADRLRSALEKQTKGQDVIPRIFVEVLDKKALASEVQAGNLPPKFVAKYATVIPRAPHVRGGKTT